MYRLNSKAHYAPYGKHQELITGKDLTQSHIIVQDNGEKSDGFDVKLPDAVFDLDVYKYLVKGDFYETDEGYTTSKSSYNTAYDPMKLWETQLNFAVHCATSGLGISTEHLNAKEPLVKALYRFHAYYHIRRILKRMLVPTPGEEGFDRYNNAYNLKEVRRIGDEYGCSTKSLFLYRNESYFDRTGRPGHYAYEHNNWSRWIMNSSHGFTKYGLEKISDSIRAYAYLILTSQSSARYVIIGKEAQSIAAQRLFYDNLEDVINKSISLQDDIARYQSILKYARSRVDYSVGKGVYMLPSNMLLKPLNQVIDGYNDKIVVNTSGHALGKIVQTAKPLPAHASIKVRSQLGVYSPGTRSGMRPLEAHNEEKMALTLGLVGLTLFAVWCS